jgi:hypothetical protein
MPLSTSSTFTLAPGITAPAESVTTPRMSPEFVFCAMAVRAGHNMARPRLARIHCFMLPPENYFCLRCTRYAAGLRFLCCIGPPPEIRQ